jgi:hypothetical protein
MNRTPIGERCKVYTILNPLFLIPASQVEIFIRLRDSARGGKGSVSIERLN